jgi:hypothetical protein
LREEDEDFGRGRTRKRDVGYFAGSDERDEQEGVESIEDDELSAMSLACR